MAAASSPPHMERGCTLGVVNHPQAACHQALTDHPAVPQFSQNPASAAVSAPQPSDSPGPFGCVKNQWREFSF